MFCEGDGTAGVGSGGGVVAVSACMSGTRGSGVLSSAGDVLVRGVSGVCDILQWYRQQTDGTKHLPRGARR